MARIKLEDIVQELAQDNWKVVSTDYQNLDAQMQFQCPEGHLVYANWAHLRTKRECPVCKQNQFKQNLNIIKPKPKGENRTLALDQASYTTGYSIFDGNQLTTYGTFVVEGEDEGKRFHEIRIWLISMINNWKPDIVGIDFLSFKRFSASLAGLIKY